MNGKYFLWWAGRTLPYVAVYLVLAVGIATLTLAMPEEHLVTASLFSYSIVIPSGVYAVVLSLHTFWYRYSRKSADFHLALRGNLHSVRWTRMLVGYLAFLLPLVLVFWYAFLLVYSRGVPVSGFFSPIAFIAFLFIESLVYFLVALPFSRAHHVVEAVVDYLVFQGVLSIGLLPLALLITLPLGRLGVEPSARGEIMSAAFYHTVYMGSPSLVGNLVFGDLFASPLFFGEAGSFFMDKGLLERLDVLVYAVLAIVALAFLLFLKEPGGERFGAAPEGISFERVLVHVAIGDTLFFLCLVIGTVILNIARAQSDGFTILALPLLVGMVLLVLAGCYILLSMFNRSFKPRKEDVRLLPIGGAFALAGLLLTFFVL